jgi:sarcosine oxidase subunit alpha
MMGVCFDCLVVVDGVGSRQGCMTRVRDGMVVETQNGRRELGR